MNLNRKKKFESVEKERLKRYKELDAKRQTMQLEKYLDRYRLERAKISGIGESRRSVLISFGIETAADVKLDEIYKIPGFGAALTQELINWRKGHEKNFRFNPNEKIDPLEVAKVD
jgi:DNA-binding helix-hairpin-helix protein with protein kinase domain